MKLVRDYTGINDNDVKARDAFINEIQTSGNYFNDKDFPNAESDKNAFIKCMDDASAKKHCPKRWEAMQTWIKNVKEVSNKYFSEYYVPIKSNPQHSPHWATPPYTNTTVS